MRRTIGATWLSATAAWISGCHAPPSLVSPAPAAQSPTIGKALGSASYLGKIEALARRAGLADLGGAKLSGDDVEVRVWTYLELAANPLYGRIVRRTGGRSEAFEVRQPVRAADPVRPAPMRLRRGTWEELWRGIEPLRTVRDEGELPDDGVAVMDGTSTIVEIATSGGYRAYLQSNPEYHRARPDAVALVRATTLLNRTLTAAPTAPTSTP